MVKLKIGRDGGLLNKAANTPGNSSRVQPSPKTTAVHKGGLALRAGRRHATAEAQGLSTCVIRLPDDWKREADLSSETWLYHFLVVWPQARYLISRMLLPHLMILFTAELVFYV